MNKTADFAQRGPQEHLRRRKTDPAKAAEAGGAHGPQPGGRDRRRRPRNSGAAAHSVIAAMFVAPEATEDEKVRQAKAAMGKPVKMSDAAIEAHLAERAKARAWCFERRKGDQPRRMDVEDAVILE